MKTRSWVLFFILLCSAVPVAAGPQIYWTRDHIYAGPGGKVIATMTPAPADATAPTTPSGLAVTASTVTSVTLGWTGSTDTGGSGLAGYKIYRGNLPVGTTAPGVVAFIDQPLTPNTAYIYSVLAFDAAQNLSAPSNAVNPTTPAWTGEAIPPSAPANLRGRGLTRAPDYKVRLDWNPSTDAGGSGVAGYRVYRDGNLVSGPNPVVSAFHEDSTATANTNYSYRVRAVDGANNASAETDAVAVTTLRELAFQDDFNRDTEFNVWGGLYIRNYTVGLVLPVTTGVWYDRLMTSQTTFRATVQVLANPAANNIYSSGIYFWGGTYSPRYRAVLAAGTLSLQFFEDPQNNGQTTLASAGGLGACPCTLTVEADSATRRIKVFHNGAPRIDFTETVTSRPNSGSVGLTSQRMTGYFGTEPYFDDFLVER